MSCEHIETLSGLRERIAAAEAHKNYLNTIHLDVAISRALSLPQPSSTNNSEILTESWKLDTCGSHILERSCRLTLLAAIGCLLTWSAKAVLSWCIASIDDRRS